MTTLAIDIGGTKIAAAVCDENDSIIQRWRVPTPMDADAINQRIAEVYREAVAAGHTDIEAIGISAAGNVSADRKTLTFSANIPAWINYDLSEHVGEYSKRGGAVMPWYHTLNFRFSQDFYINVKGKRNTISLGLDVTNLANMLNRDWGNIKRMNSSSILAWDGSNYTFTAPKWSKYASTVSTWSAMFSIRYTFN